MYQLFQRDEFPSRELISQIYMFFKRYWIHKVVSHPHVSPFVEVVEWLMKYVDPKEAMMNDSHINPIASFSALDIEIYYKIPKE